jgi:hypothetical protein
MSSSPRSAASMLHSRTDAGREPLGHEQPRRIDRVALEPAHLLLEVRPEVDQTLQLEERLQTNVVLASSVRDGGGDRTRVHQCWRDVVQVAPVALHNVIEEGFERGLVYVTIDDGYGVQRGVAT